MQRDAGTSWYPASLTKLMTMYVVFEELKAGRLQDRRPGHHVQAARERGVCRPSRRAGRRHDHRRHRGHRPGGALAERRGGRARRKGLGLGGGLRPAHDRDGAAPRHDRDAISQRPRPAQSRPGHDGARPGDAGRRAGARTFRNTMATSMPTSSMSATRQIRRRHEVRRALRALCRWPEDRLHLLLGLQHRGQRGARRPAADRGRARLPPRRPARRVPGPPVRRGLHAQDRRQPAQGLADAQRGGRRR